MGLFKRSRDEQQQQRQQQPPAAAPGAGGFGHAAFAPGDVDDARRGRPAVSLEPFAQARGWRYVPQALHHGFLSTQPTWNEYTFNTCIGPWPSGGFGVVGHELHELEAHEGSVREGGMLYDVRVMTTRSASSMLGIDNGKPNAPFAANAVWVPTTSVHLRAPQTAALPPIVVKRAVMQGFLRDPVLDQYGLPGYMMPGGRSFDDAFVAAVTQRLAPSLSQRHDPWIRLGVTHGVVAITVNGYRADPVDLDHLVSTAEHIAAALGGMVPPTPPAGFTALGPSAGQAPWPAGLPRPHPLLVGHYAADAQRLGMHNEDVTHILASSPRRPMPGMPSGVLAGNFPGTATPCRLLWTEQGGRTSGSVRGGAVFVAAPGASTPVGGVFDETTDVNTEITEGLAYVWRRTRSLGVLDTDALLAAVATTLRSNGLAPL